MVLCVLSMARCLEWFNDEGKHVMPKSQYCLYIAMCPWFMICDTIKGLSGLSKNVNSKFLMPRSHNFKMLHFWCQIRYLVIHRVSNMCGIRGCAIKQVNSKFLTPLSSNFKMLHAKLDSSDSFLLIMSCQLCRC